MTKYYSTIILFFIVFFSENLISQEVISKLSCNPVIKNYYKTHPQQLSKSKKIFQDTVSVPFFDDFSKPAIFPDPKIWDDDDAFINTSYDAYIDSGMTDSEISHNPPSIGIATLDAIDRNGNLHANLLPNVLGIGDYLTSKPIHLNFLPSTSVYLSFQYQPCAENEYGDSPEKDDSLILEFFSHSKGDSSWHHIWHALGSNDKTYRKAMIAITDTNYLKEGFRFRFKNYVTLGSHSEPSWISNSDQWNLDFIYLDTNRQYNDTNIQDVAMLYPIKSVLNNSLESMPWKHFQSVKNNVLTPSPSFGMIFKSLEISTFWNVGRLTSIEEMSGSTPLYKTDILEEIFENAYPNTINFKGRRYDYLFNSSGQDSAEFKIKCFLDLGLHATLLRYKTNDTTYYTQKFYNYYAYDDGTAEAGYGLHGQGARTALKFKCYKKDTLRGAQIFFNSTYGNYTADKYFILTAWSDVNGLPGPEIASQIGEKPHFEGLNGYYWHKFSTPVVIDSGATFYIGVIQTKIDMLNIGFDKNRDSHDNLYYNISGLWEQSSAVGALMIRPMFGKVITGTSSVENNFESEQKFDIYPNPSNDKIQINFPDDFSKEKGSFVITDLCGKSLINSSYTGSIDVSKLTSGLYLIMITDHEKYSITRKIIISR